MKSKSKNNFFYCGNCGCETDNPYTLCQECESCEEELLKESMAEKNKKDRQKKADDEMFYTEHFS